MKKLISVPLQLTKSTCLKQMHALENPVSGASLVPAPGYSAAVFSTLALHAGKR
jgi:hypothetical protein